MNARLSMSPAIAPLVAIAALVAGLTACEAPVPENEAPAVKFMNLVDGSVLDDLGATPIEIRVVDRDGDDDLALVLSSDRDGLLGEATGLAGGLEPPYTTFEVPLSLGGHLLTATVTDPSGASRDSSIVVVVDALPSPPLLGVSPSLPATTDNITLSVVEDAVDPEGSDLRYEWRVQRDGEPEDSALVGSGPTANLAASATARDQSWTFTVDTLELDDSGAARLGRPSVTTSLSFTIANTAPTAPTSVFFDVAAPVAGTTVVCTASGSADADGDPVLYEIAWTCTAPSACAAEVPVTGVQSGSTGVALPAARSAPEQTWTCTATPTDETDDGPASSASITFD